MPPTTPNNNGKSSDDRRISRLHQMEMMEAAARGTTPSMRLDTSHVAPPPSGLRSRNTSSTSVEARRFLADEEDYHNGPGVSSIQIGPAGRGSTSTGALFSDREMYAVDQSVNLMDPATESYTNIPSTKRSSFVDIFLGGSGSTSGQGSSRGRGSLTTTWQQSMGGRLFILCAFVSFGVFLAMSVSFLASDPNENDGVTSGGFVKTGNRYEDIKTILLLNSASHTEYLTDKSTSAYHALRWLTNTDPATLEADDNEILARFALASFYYATHPDAAPAHSSGKVKKINSGWKKDENWMSEKSICQWYGVDCEAIGGNKNNNKDVVHFNLTSNQVKGTIPLELRSLSNMVLLDLSHNQLSGTIPAQICRMYQITYLLLHNNLITGTIPNQIGLMEGAYEISLASNSLKGTIPSTIGNLSNLRTLSLGENELEGSIPDVTGLKGLNHLNLQENSLTGALPFSIAKLTDLHDLRLNKNQLSGTIPPEIGNYKKLELLYLGHNLLSGRVPNIFDDLHTLTDLELHNNKFNGRMPTSFRYLTSLRRLTIDSNKFSGSIPTEWGEMTDLEALGAHHCELVGPIPSEFGAMTNLAHIFLNHNFLQHELPSELGSLTSLRDLFLESNAIAGLIPSQISKMTNLEKFRIHTNIVTGTMPSTICTMLDKYKLKDLEADCKEIECDCCTKCY